MTVVGLLAIFKEIGGIVGIIITLITFFGLVSKRPRAAFRRIIREESTEANKEIKVKIEDIEKEVAESRQTDIAMLRNTITHIYFKYKDAKKIPHYEKENVLSLWERYHKLGGNHYVENCIREIESWDETL